ncbi:MAG: hypothetical protein HC902_00860 [Calothrix sp. SM1_5_4]|nr:hypothetical protein [Calothrix sp. SM1_5_4]
MAAMMFPQSPKLGETVANAVDGQRICGMNRDLALLTLRGKAEIFGACAKASGHANLMGAWYASLWWRARIQAEAREVGAGADIDASFLITLRRGRLLPDSPRPKLRR